LKKRRRGTQHCYILSVQFKNFENYIIAMLHGVLTVCVQRSTVGRKIISMVKLPTLVLYTLPDIIDVATISQLSLPGWRQSLPVEVLQRDWSQ
jgi:hypothetical protein